LNPRILDPWNPEVVEGFKGSRGQGFKGEAGCKNPLNPGILEPSDIRNPNDPSTA
jgi:hypothetical protein